MKKHLFLFLLFLLSISFIQAQSIHYVMERSTGGGTSWIDSGDLQAMITKAVSGDQIWVAAGTYQPVSPTYFELKEGVKIYGGFTGNENVLSARDWKVNETILKGTGTGNLVVRNYLNHLTSASLLDGFTIMGASRPTSDGGGIYNNTSSPAYKNCIVTGNVGNYGAGVYNKLCTSVFENVIITGNNCGKSGAGMYNDNASPTLTNVTISNNTAVEYGGGIRNHTSSSPTLKNVLIANNQSQCGGGIYNSADSNPTLTNLTISGNTATHLTEGGGGIYNLDSSPVLRNTIIWGNTANGSVSVFNEKTTYPDNWVLKFEDNFDGVKVDESIWGIYNGGAGPLGIGLTKKEAFTVENGLLVVSTFKDQNGVIISGGMAHYANYLYGRIEFKVKMDSDPLQSVGGVILTWPKGGNWPIDGEMDIYECAVKDNTFSTFIHYGADNSKVQYRHDVDKTEWHIIRIDWFEDALFLFRDGVKVWELKDKAAIPKVMHHLCIQAGPNKPTMGDPVRMYVDWVKIYQLE